VVVALQKSNNGTTPFCCGLVVLISPFLLVDLLFVTV
jgi:hypothetical protein